MKSTFTVPIAILIGGVIVAVAVYLSVARTTQSLTSSGSGNPALVRPVGSGDHILGNPSAPVMIVEYSDFDCDFCKSFHETLHQIVANEGANGQVAWVYRQFPLIEIHPNAMKHAEAAECVAQVASNDVFWKFAGLLFKNQPVDPSSYGILAANAGVTDSSAFTTCYTNAASTVDARINADRENALVSGAQGTPYSIILAKGKLPVVMSAAYSYDAVKLLVDQALSK